MFPPLHTLSLLFWLVLSLSFLYVPLSPPHLSHSMLHSHMTLYLIPDSLLPLLSLFSLPSLLTLSDTYLHLIVLQCVHVAKRSETAARTLALPRAELPGSEPESAREFLIFAECSGPLLGRQRLEVHHHSVPPHVAF